MLSFKLLRNKLEHGKQFQHRPTFVSKAGAYLRGAPIRAGSRLSLENVNLLFMPHNKNSWGQR
jgi:hypothetical protein